MHSHHERWTYVLIYLVGVVLVQPFNDIIADDPSFVGGRAGGFASDGLREWLHGTKRRAVWLSSDCGMMRCKGFFGSGYVYLDDFPLQSDFKCERGLTGGLTRLRVLRGRLGLVTKTLAEVQ